jgi:hypothetical protein
LREARTDIVVEIRGDAGTHPLQGKQTIDTVTKAAVAQSRDKGGDQQSKPPPEPVWRQNLERDRGRNKTG